MDRLSAIIQSFVEVMSTVKSQVPHNKVAQFLSKLLDIAEIFSSSVDKSLLQDLLSTLLKQEPNLKGENGVNLLVSSINVIDFLLKRLFEQMESMEKLQYLESEISEGFLAKIDELDHIVENVTVSRLPLKQEDESLPVPVEQKEMYDESLEGKGMKEMHIAVDINFQSVCSNPNYISHYTSHHRDFTSLVVVVVWKSVIPGPSLCHDGMPVLYVHNENVVDEISEAWREFQLDTSSSIPREYTPSELQDARRVNSVIAQHQRRLFAAHSNLVAIRPSAHANGTFCIELVVLCKHFVPVIDHELLPRHLDDIPTRVCSGWIELCGWNERAHHRPLLPGAGFAAGADAELVLNSDTYNPLMMGTIGGYYSANGIMYGVTCAHCCISINKQGDSSIHSAGTPVFQPCVMGLILGAASTEPELIDAYETLKSTKGLHGAMQWLIEQLGGADFTSKLSSVSQCGVVHSAVLGALREGGTAVDVALVELSVEAEAHCVDSLKFPELKSPLLMLSDQSDTKSRILEPSDFPRSVFSVFGRGAQSVDTMQADVDPFQSSIYFRVVQSKGLGDMVFHCIHSTTQKNWQSGDSGTWCWTEDGLLLGMAYAHIDNQHYCCIQPMAHVVEAIKQLI